MHIKIGSLLAVQESTHQWPQSNRLIFTRWILGFFAARPGAGVGTAFRSASVVGGTQWWKERFFGKKKSLRKEKTNMEPENDGFQ